jgi:hypothetical protein
VELTVEMPGAVRASEERPGAGRRSDERATLLRFATSDDGGITQGATGAGRVH